MNKALAELTAAAAARMPAHTASLIPPRIVALLNHSTMLDLVDHTVRRFMADSSDEGARQEVLIETTDGLTLRVVIRDHKITTAEITRHKSLKEPV